MSLKQLKREIEIVQKAINPSPTGYDWRRESAEIQQLLKDYESLTAEERAAQNAEVLRAYANGELK